MMAVRAPLFPLSAAGFSAEDDESLGSASSSSSSSSSSEMEDGDAATSAESSSPGGVGDVGKRELQSPLFEMSCLIAQLPYKRGLSRHFDGKSQSFASLSDVKCLMDLAKKTNERPYCSRKKKKRIIKPSRSFAGGLDCQSCLSPAFSSRTITKKPSRSSSSSSCSSSSMSPSSSSAAPKRQHGCCFRPPLPPPPPPQQQQIIMNSDGFPAAAGHEPCPLYA